LHFYALWLSEIGRKGWEILRRTCCKGPRAGFKPKSLRANRTEPQPRHGAISLSWYLCRAFNGFPSSELPLPFWTLSFHVAYSVCVFPHSADLWICSGRIQSPPLSTSCLEHTLHYFSCWHFQGWNSPCISACPSALNATDMVNLMHTKKLFTLRRYIK
jgi:hypothetical protein